MKATHTKHGQVEIKEVKDQLVIVVTASGETKMLPKFMTTLTDENGNVIDLNNVKIEKEAFNFPVSTLEEQAERKAKREKARAEKEAFQSWKSEKSYEYMIKGIKTEY